MNLRKLLAVLAAALLFLGACGGGDDSNDDASSDTTEASDDSGDRGDDSTDDTDLGDLGDLAGLDEECLTASGAALSLGFMPLMFAFGAMGQSMTDDTLFTETDIEEMQTAIDDLKESVPSELEGDVETLADMTSDAFEDPEAFDESEWESAMEGITTYLEEECGDAFEGFGQDLEGLEGDLEDLSDLSIPE